VPDVVTQRHFGETCLFGKVSGKAGTKDIDRPKTDGVEHNQAACMSKICIKSCGMRVPVRRLLICWQDMVLPANFSL
jgi:hypothetical protein